MSSIAIHNLVKWYDKVIGLENVNMYVKDGEFMVLLGPSGCGKTTTLRCLAGLEEPTDGEIFMGDRCLFSISKGIDISPKDRNVGFVFQNYALYPHMTVFQNVVFPLKNRGFPADEIGKKVPEVLEHVRLDGLSDRFPRQLSGGQRQRVAVARVLATDPKILLFDEPLSNLDAKLRGEVRTEIRRIHRNVKATTLYVTHDQEEAMMMADRIAVMNDGKVLQIGTPYEIYHFPETVFVAGFTGNPQTNFLSGTVQKNEGNTVLVPEADSKCRLVLPEECSTFHRQKVILNIRPEDVEVFSPPGEDDPKLSVYANTNQGSEQFVYLSFQDEKTEVMARGQTLGYGRWLYGQVVGLCLRKGNVYSVETERLIGSFGYSRS